MTVLRTLFAFLIPLGIGYLVMAVIDRGRHLRWFEKWILGYFPGIGILMTTMFLMGILSIRLLLGNICVWLVAIAALLVGVLWRFPAPGSSSAHPAPMKGPADWILLSVFSIVLLYKVALAMVFTLQSPTYQDDSLQRWNMRAKVFYYRGELVLDRQDPEFLGQPGWREEAHKKVRTRAYPPHTSLYKTWVALAMGRYEDEAVNLVNPATYCFFCLSILSLLSRIVGWRRGLIGGYIILSIPYLWIHASNPYAEIFVLSYCTLASTSLIKAIETKSNAAFLWYFALNVAFLPFTKKEGLFLSAVLLGVYGVWLTIQAMKWDRGAAKGEISLALLPAAPFLVLVAVWTGYQYFIGGSFIFEGYQSNSDTSIFLRAKAVKGFINALFGSGNYNIFPATLLGVMIWKAPKILKTNLRYLFLVFVIMAAAVFFQLSFTPASIEAVRGTGVNRALIEILPTGILGSYLAVVYQTGHDA